jgi:hypothetical protein
MPLGFMTKEPTVATTTWPPMSKVSSPSNTKLHSSSREWVCGGIISPGERRASMLEKTPSKASAVTLWVMRRVGR